MKIRSLRSSAAKWYYIVTLVNIFLVGYVLWQSAGVLPTGEMLLVFFVVPVFLFFLCWISHKKQRILSLPGNMDLYVSSGFSAIMLWLATRQEWQDLHFWMAIYFGIFGIYMLSFDMIFARQERNDGN